MALALVSNEQQEINQIALAEFKEHRQELKKPLTPLAEKKACNVLRPFSLTQQQYMVDQAILNGWRGLFPVNPPRTTSCKSNSIEDDINDRSWA